MPPITTIKIVANDTDRSIVFQKIDESDKNRNIPKNKIRSVDANVPWATSSSEFNKHHIEIQRRDSVIFYIWQRKIGNDDLVRYSTGGFEEPGDPIPGNSKPGGNRALRISNEGNDIELDNID